MDDEAHIAGINVLHDAEGVFPFFMADSGAQKFNLKSGKGIADLVKNKRFNKKIILQDISKYGFMCPFEPCEKKLQDCELDEFVIVCDPKSTYGEMFLLLYKTKAIESYMSGKIVVKETLNEFVQKPPQIEKEDIATHIGDINNIKIDEFFFAKPYHSTTMEGSIQEVYNSLNVPSRSPLSLRVNPIVSNHISPKQFDDCDNSFCHTFEIPQHVQLQKDRQLKKMYDVPVQAIPEHKNVIIQTNQYAKVDNSTQYESFAIKGPLQYYKLLPLIIKFLKRSLPQIETALQENETVDIFKNILHVEQQPDVVHIGHENSNQLKETKNFTDLELSKGKTLASIDWHPTKNDVIATAVSKEISFDDSLNTSSLDEAGYIIIWEFSEWIHPLLVLRSPVECTCFRYNPTNPDIVIGGCKNGQIAIWNLAEEQRKAFSFSLPGSFNGNEFSKKKRSGRVVLKPLALTNPEHNHRRYVSDIVWLPPNMQINAKGRLLSKAYESHISHQFLTISGDGYVMFWDIRFKEILEGTLPHIGKPKVLLQQKRKSINAISSERQTSNYWMPLFKIKVKRLEAAGEVSLCQIDYSPHATPNSGHQILCSSEEGDLLSVRWLQKQSKEKEDMIEEPEYTEWIASDHKRPPKALERSPFFPEILVSISDWNFHLWNIGEKMEEPFFKSPKSPSMLTGGRWSPTRPGVLLVSKSDGNIDFWDLSESSKGPSSSLLVTPNAITSMEFLHRKEAERTEEKVQHLALGDSQGSLHIFEVSKILSTPLGKEFNSVSNFFQNELKRFNASKTLYKDGKGTRIMNKLDTSISIDASINPTSPDIKNEGISLPEEEKAYKELELNCLKQLEMA